MRERVNGGVQYEESGLASPDLLVEGLEPGAAYIAAVTSINKKVSWNRRVQGFLEFEDRNCICVFLLYSNYGYYRRQQNKIT